MYNLIFLFVIKFIWGGYFTTNNGGVTSIRLKSGMSHTRLSDS